MPTTHPRVVIIPPARLAPVWEIRHTVREHSDTTAFRAMTDAALAGSLALIDDARRRAMARWEQLEDLYQHARREQLRRESEVADAA